MCRWWQNCFWLMLPVLLINLALGDHLPAVLLGEAGPGLAFWLSLLETGLRLAITGLPLFMPLIWTDRRGRAGLLVYGVGLGLYGLTWLPLVFWPDTMWSTSLPGLLAPALTPLIWLFGIALVGDRHYRWLRLPSGTYFAFASGFVAIHLASTALSIWPAVV